MEYVWLSLPKCFGIVTQCFYDNAQAKLEFGSYVFYCSRVMALFTLDGSWGPPCAMDIFFLFLLLLFALTIIL
jgi:hypothetical protein